MKTLTTNRLVTFVYYLNTLTFLFCFNLSSAQPDLPQRSNTVRATQAIHFGSFCITGGSGGTITVDPNGIRSSTGDILLLNIPPFAQPAIFEIKLNQKPTVCINFEPPYIPLYGSSGSIELNLGPTNQGPDGTCFSLNPNHNIASLLRVGGILTVTGSPSAGLYSGNFAIKFTQQ